MKYTLILLDFLGLENHLILLKGHQGFYEVKWNACHYFIIFDVKKMKVRQSNEWNRTNA